MATIVLMALTIQTYISLERGFERIFTGKCLNTIQTLIKKGESAKVAEA